jgi:hypothetical protein
MQSPMLLLLITILCFAVASAHSHRERNNEKLYTRVRRKPERAVSTHRLGNNTLRKRNVLHVRGGRSKKLAFNVQHNMICIVHLRTCALHRDWKLKALLELMNTSSMLNIH